MTAIAQAKNQQQPPPPPPTNVPPQRGPVQQAPQRGGQAPPPRNAPQQLYPSEILAGGPFYGNGRHVVAATGYGQYSILLSIPGYGSGCFGLSGYATQWDLGPIPIGYQFAVQGFSGYYCDTGPEYYGHGGSVPSGPGAIIVDVSY